MLDKNQGIVYNISSAKLLSFTLKYTILIKAMVFMNTLEKNLKFSILFEIYGKLLTKKQQEIFSLYYDEDLSLSEIAENCNITRQAVLDSIRKSEKNLIDFENKLEIISKKERIQGLINKINSQSDKNQLLITIESIKKLL